MNTSEIPTISKQEQPKPEGSKDLFGLVEGYIDDKSGEVTQKTAGIPSGNTFDLAPNVAITPSEGVIQGIDATLSAQRNTRSGGGHKVNATARVHGEQTDPRYGMEATTPSLVTQKYEASVTRREGGEDRTHVFTDSRRASKLITELAMKKTQKRIDNARQSQEVPQEEIKKAA